jgi:anti-sigma B factor antagonist
VTDPSVFTLRSSLKGSALVLTVAGDVDLASAPELSRAIELVPSAVAVVVADLTAVTFLDSSGINALLRGQRELASSGIAFRVVTAAGGPVRRVLELMQLTEALALVDSLDAALAEGAGGT